MNRSAEQTNHVNREKKTLIPYIYNASNKDPFKNSPSKEIQISRRNRTLDLITIFELIC